MPRDAETRLNDALAGVPPRDRTTALITSIIADGQHDETACTCMVLIQVGVRMARTLPLDERAPISTLMSEELKALGVCWH